MFTVSDKYKAFGAALVGLAGVVIAQFVKDPTLLAAITGVLATVVVYAVPNS